MYFMGIDIGSRGAKGIILEDGNIVARFVGDSGPESSKSAEMVRDAMLHDAGLDMREISHVVATGYGRVLVPFAKENISEISCHAKGAQWSIPSVRTILDMGGQDCKAINVDEKGQVTHFIMNDKCAGGTGRFLELIASVLDLKLEEIGRISLESTQKIAFNTICAVFAKSEALGLQRKGVAKEDILAGLHDAISTRCLNLLKRVNIESDFTISGGVAKNPGLVAKIKEKVGLDPILMPDPQIAGALGAALFARERFLTGRAGANADVVANYGYSDGSGDYLITIDTSKCDGCGRCFECCPAEVFEVAPDDAGKPVARVKDEVVSCLSHVCPGFEFCSASLTGNCHAVCKQKAISHSW